MEGKCSNLPYLKLMQASKALQERMREELSNNNLTITEFSVLEALYFNGKQTIQQIRNSVLISSGSMTYVIDKLESRGLLLRNSCPEDRRVIHVILSNQGKGLMEKVIPQQKELTDLMFDCLKGEEKTNLVSLLEKVIIKTVS